MNVRTLLVAFVALSLAGLTALFARQWLDKQRVQVAAPIAAPAAPSAAVEVLVAREKLQAGSFVKPEHMRWQAWPEATLAPAYVVKGKGDKGDMNSFVGAVVRHSIAPGEPVTAGRVVMPGDRGFLAAVLAPGMRAVSVSINAETGISGLVFPGDRVDLILAHAIRTQNTEGGAIRRASETVLTDVRVIAIDQSTREHNEKPAVAKTVTFEVTPKQAEVIAIASEIGKLSLSLRSLAVAEDASRPSAPPTWDNDMSQVIGRAKGEEVWVMRGAKAEAISVTAKELATPSALRGAFQ
jgi:pilus assembly protein CpaB